MPQRILLPRPSAEMLAKARVSGYTRKDGTFVPEHNDSRPEKHPSVVGKFENHRVIHPSGYGDAPGNGDPTHATTVSVDFAGDTYHPTGDRGRSLHDDTPVHGFEHEPSGHRLWADKHGNAHADDKTEKPRLRKKYADYKKAKAASKKAASKKKK